jgi:hypothetical protein
MIIEGGQFVAKELVDTGNGRGNVSLPEAVRFLSADLARLKRMEYFAKAFFIRAEQEGAELTCAILLLFCYTLCLFTLVCSFSNLRRLSCKDVQHQSHIPNRL